LSGAHNFLPKLSITHKPDFLFTVAHCYQVSLASIFSPVAFYCAAQEFYGALSMKHNSFTMSFFALSTFLKIFFLFCCGAQQQISPVLTIFARVLFHYLQLV
jgi:hypothetical protein